MFPCFLKSLGAKVKIVFFDASQAQNHGIYGVFCSWYQKPRYLQCFVAGTLQKQWYLRSFQHVARSTFSMPKAQKHCKWQCFGFWHPMKNVRKTSENNQKCPKWSFSFNLKNEGSGASFFWALPRQAPASPSQNAAKSEPPPHTPQTSFASLRLYLYSAQAFGWLS